MPFVISAVLPHTPLLIPNIGKANRNLFPATLQAAKHVTDEFKKVQPDIIIVITNHGPRLESAFAINIAPQFISDFKDFGDLVTRTQYTGNIGLVGRIRETLELLVPIRLVTNTELDYAASTALFLAGVGETTPIIPISVSGADSKSQFIFGKQLQAILLKEDLKIAVLGAVDLSHRLTKNSPAGYSPKAKKIDQKIITALVNKKSREILNLSPTTMEETSLEDNNTLALFLGLLDGFDSQPRLLSYENPFGVGHSVILYSFQG